MPFGEYSDFEDCVSKNSDKSDPDAYCAAIKRKIEGENALSDAEREAAENSECPTGEVNIDGRCVPVEEVDDVPPSSLDMSAARIMASAESLDTQPIKREELGDGKVRYASIKLVSEGVWTDQASKTPTLYNEETFSNTQPDFDSGEFDGPPVNIAHDIHKGGPNKGEPHEASIGGYIDPDSLDTDGKALFGDIILDRNTDAGAFADTNLKSALENDGTAGFSPSVELMPTEMKEAAHPHAEEHVAAAELTGTGLVRDPASKSVDFAYETQNRAVAMSAGGKDAKVMTRENGDMRTKLLSGMAEKLLADPDEVRETLDMFGFDGLDEMTDDEVTDMAEDLHEDLTSDLEGMDEEGEGEEMGEGEEYDDDEEEDEQEMQEGEDMEALKEQVSSLSSRLEDLEDAMSQAMSADEVTEELQEAKEELAAAETVAELTEAKEELDKRLSELESQGKTPKTLSDANTDAEEWEPTYDSSPVSPSGW
ncbi:P2 gpO-like scaffolding/protease protein [Haloferax tailed virus 1]|uniref:P2 gpO-like scaffolding/protease protein n=1 Tax=Haloferax tailed virus 1 TaxID=2507575 RepID=A0A410N6U2_HFTV1|nr:P2 gpO-like scaffolding/protease protein [Haloferax tailed virus 1]QAS68850.1 P2 gpO-like scaffolding/protease protein [Haloferax tailed virus 1]